MQITDHDNWFSLIKQTDDYLSLVEKPVAYFCAEYALATTLPTYAGGLGILAGDMVREAAARKFPIIFIGLRYKKGQHDTSFVIKDSAPEVNKLDLLLDEGQRPLELSLPLHGRTVYFRAWRWHENSTSVYLLDTDIDSNQEIDRQITRELYSESRELRLKQEILLGIGGHRLLRRLGHHPSVYHLNEGHSAFLALELVHHEMEHQKVDFQTACEYAKRHLLFSNHTVVAAGQEMFDPELVVSVLHQYAKEIDVPIENIVLLGLTAPSDLFSMTMFSLRFSSRANAVSKLHQQIASSIWPTFSFDYVTNGIHLPQWDSITNVETLWSDHQQNKRKLLSLIEEQTGKRWGEHVLLFGWARRLVPYKQPLAFIEDIERVAKLARESGKEFRIVFSGPTKATEETEPAMEIKKRIQEKLGDIAVFLPRYNVVLSKLLVAGCDVWLNTPVIGSEACGTSGMKAGLNGVLPLSTRDGWVGEANLETCGWIIDGEDIGKKLLDKVEYEIVPLYYDHINNPENSKWLSYMKMCREIISKQFSLARAFREYIEKFYIPIMQQKHEHTYD